MNHHRVTARRQEIPVQDYNADGLSDQDIERLAVLMAKNLKFANELADAVAKRLDETFGFRQGEIVDKLDEISEKLTAHDHRFDDMDRRFDTLEHNFGVFGEKLDLVEKRTERIEKLLSKDGGGLKVRKLVRG